MREAQTEISASVMACPTRKVLRDRALSSSARARVKPGWPHRRWALNSSQWSTCRHRRHRLRTSRGWDTVLKHTHLRLLHGVGSIQAKSWGHSSQEPADGVAIVELNDAKQRKESTGKQHVGYNTPSPHHDVTDVDKKMPPTLRPQASYLFLPPPKPPRCF